MRKRQNNQMKRLLLSLLPIQSLAVGLPSINFLLSSFVVGHYLGTSALAAVGFAAPLTYLSSILSQTLTNGSQIKSGQELGRGNQDSLSKIFNSTIAFALVSGTLLALVLMVLNSGIVDLLGASAELAQITQGYILGMAPSIALGAIFSVLLSFMHLERAERESAAAVVVLILVNTAFNFLNIYVLHWGLFGIGLSASLANLAAIAVSAPYFLRKSSAFRFSSRDIDLAALKQVLYLGMPSAISPICFFLRDRILNHFMFILGGTAAIAALTVASNIANAVGCTLEAGYAGSSNLLASVLVGERDVESLRALPKTMITTMLPIYTAAYALVFLFSRPLAQLFGAEATHMELYTAAIRFLNFWYITNSFFTPSLVIYLALGRVKPVSIFRVLSDLVIPALTAVSGMIFGFMFVFNFSWITEALIFIVYIIYYAHCRRKLPRSIFRVTDIPCTLSVPSADRRSAAIRNIRDAMNASADIADFCRRKGLSSRDAMLCGLCVEELAVDTILHGFTRGKGAKYSIHLGAIYENGGITLTLRDNCPHFDPKEWLAMQADPNDDRSLGIRLAAKSAKEMNYTSALGLNIVTIRI